MTFTPQEPRFIGAQSELLSGAPAIFGVPYDKTASFRKGTFDGPRVIREVSAAAIETYSPALNCDLEDFTYADLGNLEIDPEMDPKRMHDTVLEATRTLFDQGAIPVLLGGEHSVSPGAIRAAFERYPDLVVIQIDAHADLRESYEGSHHSHACAMRRVLDFLPPDQLLQVGIRSGTKEEYREMREFDRLIKPNGDAVANEFREISVASVPVWVTLDIDTFDPSEAPGTGTPEAGGITWAQAESIRESLEKFPIVGFDLVEVAPGLDPSGITGALAAKLLRNWLLTIMNRIPQG